MTRKSVAFAAVLFILTVVASPFLAAGSPGQATAQVAPLRPAGPQPAPEKPRAETKPEAKAETIHPAPKNIKEKSAVFVFLAWLWLTIGILIYVLALKIREADRIHSLNYYHPRVKSRGPRFD